MNPRDEIVIYDGDGWSAAYLNGKLVPNTGGDSYLADEWLRSYVGVETRTSDAFLRGTGREVAPTLAEVEVYEAERRWRQDQAAGLRAEAERLIATAATLEG